MVNIYNHKMGRLMKERLLHSPKMKTLHVYNGIYYAWEKKPRVPPNAGSKIQSCVGILNLISWGVSKTHHTIGHEFPYIFNTKGGN